VNERKKLKREKEKLKQRKLEERRKRKVCPTCGGEKSLYSKECHKCYLVRVCSKESRAARSRAYYQRYGKGIYIRKTERKKAIQQELREDVLTYYSVKAFPICAFCRYEDKRGLEIGHIEEKSWEKGRRSGKALYEHLRSLGFPEGYQVLCRNCNWIKFLESQKREVGKT